MLSLELYHSDCLTILKTMPDDSVDSIVTDPPYGISFMGKKWDYDVPSVEIWTECLRVLKPGAHILVACGTRTQHRMAVNIEDAGFEIRDTVAWIYGSGFPKNLDVSKAIDKLKGEKRELSGQIKTRHGGGVGKSGQIAQLNPDWKETPLTLPTSLEAKQWNGWGTALKPAMELWTLARKPFKGTVAENVLQYGTGAINIDGCRIPYTGETDPRTFGGSWKTDKAAQNVYEGGYEGVPQTVSERGRFPANVIHDGSDAIEPLGESARFFYCAKASKSDRNEGLEDFPVSRPDDRTIIGMGTFEEKGVQPQQNHHPTVKPTQLMQYLCRLITPPQGTVLDPFMGSGSTGKACVLEGFGFIGIEREEEYVKIAQARIDAVTRQEALF